MTTSLDTFLFALAVAAFSILLSAPCYLLDRLVLRTGQPWWIWLLPGANLGAAARLGNLSLFRFSLAILLFIIGWNLMVSTADVEAVFGVFRLGGLWITFASFVYGAVVLGEWFRNIGACMNKGYRVVVWGWIIPVALALGFLAMSVFGVMDLDIAIGCAGLMMAYVWLYLVWLSIFSR